MVKTALLLQGARVQSLVGELRSHMPCSVAKKQQQQQQQNTSVWDDERNIYGKSNIWFPFEIIVRVESLLIWQIQGIEKYKIYICLKKHPWIVSCFLSPNTPPPEPPNTQGSRISDLDCLAQYRTHRRWSVKVEWMIEMLWWKRFISNVCMYFLTSLLEYNCFTMVC